MLDIISGSLCQGASAISNVQRFGDIQPKLGIGSASHQITQTTYGITRQNNSGIINDNIIEYNISTIISLYVSGAGQPIGSIVSGMTRDANIEYDNDGVIEVLDVKTSLVDYPLPIMKRKIISDINTGATILQFKSYDTGSADPFIEKGNNGLLPTTTFISPLIMSSGSIVSISEKLIITTGSFNIITPYNDTYGVTQIVSLDMLTLNRINFTAALMQLSGSSDGFLFKRQIFSAGGSTYHDSTFGTDSIAFGGMMGYKQS